MIITQKLNQYYKKLVKYYGEDYVFGIFKCDDSESKYAGVIIPSFDMVCLNHEVIEDTILLNDNGDWMKVIDIRLLYNATGKGHKEMIQGIHTENYFINPKYLFLYNQLLRDKKEVITEGAQNGTPAEELKIAIMKIMRFTYNETSDTIKFIKQLSDAEKIALEGIIAEVGEKGTFSQAIVASNVGVSRLTMTNLVNKMRTNNIAIIDYLGPKGTYLEILDPTLLNIRGV